MREARYQFYLKYKNWSFEDWKNVIWLDETTTMLSHRQGAIRVWKTKKKYDNTVIKTHWKKVYEFIF